MSWQATAWALRQKVGSPARKLTLLAVANYADENGECWPSQGRLAEDTEQSVDTVQRHIKKLIALGVMRVAVRPQGRGRWSGRTYFLNIDVAEMSKPQSAARSADRREGVEPVITPQTAPEIAHHHAANTTATMPHSKRPPCRTAMRHEPLIEPPIEPSIEPSKELPEDHQVDGKPPTTKPRASAAERQTAWQKNRIPVETTQHRIAVRLERFGLEGWETLGRIHEKEPSVLEKLTRMEERGYLDDNFLLCTGRQYAGLPQQ